MRTAAVKSKLKKLRQLATTRDDAILIGLVWASGLAFSERVQVAWGILIRKWGPKK